MRVLTSPSELRIKCAPVRSIKEGGEVARRLSSALEAANKKAVKAYRKDGGKHKALAMGVGLAAPQLGIAKRVCLVKTGAAPQVLMNPTIVGHSDERIPTTEGCLSLPGVVFKTWRYIWVEVETLNLGRVVFGPKNPSEYSSGSLLASFAAQHEIAHLAGLLVGDFTNDSYPPPSEWATWEPVRFELEPALSN